MLPNSSQRSRRPLFRTIESNPYMLVRQDPARGIVLVTRRSQPYPDMPTLHWVFDRLLAAYSGLSRQDHRIIVDTRPGPVRNDEAFEEALATRRPESLRGFSRIVMIVRTVTGRLQIGRHAQADGMSVFISSDLREINHELDISLDEAILADPDAR